MEGTPEEELGGEEARDCDWAREGPAAGKVLLRRLASACVEAVWGGKEAWAGPASDLTERFRNREHLPWNRLFVKCPDNGGQGMRDWLFTKADWRPG